MQRAKHADRKQETRTKILIGEAAMRAGAFAMPVAEIEAVLAHYVTSGGNDALKAFVVDYQRSTNGGSEADRRGGAEIEPMAMSERVHQ